MNSQQARSLLCDMVNIPSLSGAEQDLAAYLCAALRDLDFNSHIDEVGNVIGQRGSVDGPLILLLGHMDTVPEVLPVYQEGTLLYGRGVVDAKGSLATLICAAAQTNLADAQLIVVGAVEEETPRSRGARALIDRYAPDAVIIGEPSGWSNIVLGYKGRLELHYEVRRPSSHNADPSEKATTVAIEFWQRLVAHLAAYNDSAGMFERPIATLEQMHGSIEHATLRISCRIPPAFAIDEFEAFLETIRGTADVRIVERTSAVRMERDTVVARALTQSIRACGTRPTYKLKSGTSDMNVVAERWPVPMVAYGPGDSRLDHTPDEHLDLEEYDRAIAVLSVALPLLVAELKQQRAQSVYSSEEEAELTRRLEALGYLE